MKRKLYMSAVALVIAGLLITSVSGMMNIDTQMMTETENIEIEGMETETESIEIDGVGTLVPANIALNSNVKAAPSLLNQVNDGTFARQTMSMQSVQAKAVEREQTRATIVATHPALGTEPWVDGISEAVVLGHFYFYDDGAGVVDGPAVLWQGSNDNVQSWGSGLYYVDAAGDPINLDYPSMHFRGYNDSTGDVMFSGSCVDKSTGLTSTKGGATWTVLVEGDPTINASYTGSHWDWSTYGWKNAVMAEAASVLYPSELWAWGFNSHVMSTTYTYPEMTATDFQTDGCFINYQTDGTGYGTISWYSEFGGCLSTDAVIDANSPWIANGTAAPYAGYAVWDPSTFNGTTNFTHYMALRAFDWERTCPLDNSSAFDTMYWWSSSTEYSMEHPAIEAHDGDVIIMTEIVNMSNPAQVDIAIYGTHDGDPANINLTGYLSLNVTGAIKNPEVRWVDGETFIAHVTIDTTLYTLVSYDGGDSWEGLYIWYDDVFPALINEYRNCDISDEGRMSIWEVDNTTVDPEFLLRYTFNTVNYKGHCTYEYGDPAPLSLVTITNENTSRVLPANIDGSDYQRDLIGGLDIWSTSPITIHAEDTTVPAYENTTTVVGETDNVEVFDLVLYQPIPPELSIELTYNPSGFAGMHTTPDPLLATDYEFTIIATDGNGDPVQGILAGDFDLSVALGAKAANFCPLADHTTWTVLDAQTDANGRIRFTIEIRTYVTTTTADITGSGGYVTITADHDDYESDNADVLVNAFDYEPDGDIDANDFTYFGVDFGTNTQRNDYDFDGDVDANDFTYFGVEFGTGQIC